MKYSLLFLTLLALDLITKTIFTDKHFLFINYQENYGAAFSILQGYKLLFIIAAVIVILVILIYYKKVNNKLPLIFLLAGTSGNLIDRIYFGYVRDFIDIKVWPVFNIADSLNTIGVILLIYSIIKENRKS